MIDVSGHAVSALAGFAAQRSCRGTQWWSLPAPTQHRERRPLPLRIYMGYAPPNHIDGRIHATKLIADADLADEEFGQAVR